MNKHIKEHSKIRVMKELKYKSCGIYIRQLDVRFEYLFINQWKLYHNYIIAKPKWYRRFRKEQYTKDELKRIVETLYHGAKAHIDQLRTGA